MHPHRWKWVSRSETGARHLGRGEPGQDFHLCIEVNGYLIIGMADGAGSRTFSGTGAKIAVHTAVTAAAAWAQARTSDASRQPLTAGDKVELGLLDHAICRRAAERITAEAERRERPPSDFATTLGITIAAERWVMSGGLGDVACFCGLGSEWDLVNRVVKHGATKAPLVRSRTLLISLYSGPPTTWFRERKPGEMLVVCTDGALGEFAQDRTPLMKNGLYVPKPKELQTFSSAGSRVLCASERFTQGPRESPEQWLSSYISRLLEEAEGDDCSIAFALAA